MSGILHENLFTSQKDDFINKLPNVVRNLLSYTNPVSSLGIKYPSLRDHPLKVGSLWMAGKRLDDDTDGLWRIHDKLYDFSEFVTCHPGGADWLTLTKGTDITEAFECHHISHLPETLLPEYFVKEAKVPRNCPFTFKEDGFYRVLKKEIHKALKTVPKTPADRSKYITDLLFISYIGFSLLAVYTSSYILGVVAGLMLSLAAIAAHNFFHQKDNFRMYYFDFTLMQSKEWRISHALSHHLFPNTILDIEISLLEPFFQYLPNKNLLLFRYFSWLYTPLVYAFLFLGHFVRSFFGKFVFGEPLELVQFLPFTVLIAMYITIGQSLVNCSIMFAWIITMGSIFFATIGVNAGHHHPNTFHDGDATRSKDDMDWGIFQLDAVIDRKDITGSHFLVLTSFGDHAIHHLFPTIDHGLLEYLYPVFIKTCEQFGVEWQCSTSADCVKGQFQQLMKTEPNAVARGKISVS